MMAFCFYLHFTRHPNFFGAEAACGCEGESFQPNVGSVIVDTVHTLLSAAVNG